jgi:hypothetical protein
MPVPDPTDGTGLALTSDATEPGREEPDAPG